jgi:hypothetical protein
VESNQWVRVNANGNDGISESPFGLAPLPKARHIVEIRSHFLKFLDEGIKLAHPVFFPFFWAHMQFYK